VRLLDAEKFARPRLRQAALLHDLVDLQRQAGLEQLLLRVRQTEIGKHIAAALPRPYLRLAHAIFCLLRSCPP
jgi:hypothetical protein